MRRNQSDCRISNLDQSEGRILYHVTWPRVKSILRSGTELVWVLVSLGQHGIEATGSDVIKPEVNGNQRQTTWFDKNNFIQRSGLLCGLVCGLSGGVGGFGGKSMV